MVITSFKINVFVQAEVCFKAVISNIAFGRGLKFITSISWEGGGGGGLQVF